MTDAVQTGTEWVPRFGMLEVPAERAELIRGLFELAAWVADHPELPLPRVTAAIYPDGEWVAQLAVVDEVAEALGVKVRDRVEAVGHYEAETSLGHRVTVRCTAITDERLGRWQAYSSYADNVQPEPVAAEVAGGAR